MKKLSIIIPVYNKKKYLNDCLKSLVESLNDDFEIILVDDGSTDNSSEVYNQYKDSLIIVKQDNQGVSCARNVGIERSIGKYIMFVDSDDFLDTNWFDIVSAELNNSDDMIVFSENIDNTFFTIDQLLSYTLNIKKNKFYFSNPVSKLYNSKFLKKNNIKFDENIKNGEDMLFNIKCFLAANDIKFVRKSFYNYIINETSVVNNFDVRQISSDYLFQKTLKEILSSSNLIDDNFLSFYTSNMASNGIISLLHKISLSNGYNNYRRLLKDINIAFYINSINYKNILDMKKKLLFLFLYFRLYFFLYFIFRTKKRSRRDNVIKM